MVILICIGASLIIYGAYSFIKAIRKSLQALYYLKFANDDKVDNGYVKHILSKTKEYQDFKSKIDNQFKDGI